jgi:hypothetical protein
MYLTRAIQFRRNSGIVISGYGNNDLFPSIVAYSIAFMVNDKLNYSITYENTVSFRNSAMIVPFAQSEMVSLFIEGIDRDYEKQLIGSVDSMFDEYHKNLLQQLNAKDEESASALNDLKDQLINNLHKVNSKYKEDHFIDPIVESVSDLPTSELAEMAESLVNLTSFKRKMSKNVETVGGPTDVALITKGDGFVWIKRKKTFPSDINEHYTCSLYYHANGEYNEE